MDELAGARLAEMIMELHPVTVPQGLAMLSAFRCGRLPNSVRRLEERPRGAGDGHFANPPSLNLSFATPSLLPHARRILTRSVLP